MSIIGNVGILTTDIGAVGADTVVFDFTNRIAVSAFSIHNTLGFNRKVSIYASPDLTSAAGKRVAVYEFGPDEPFGLEPADFAGIEFADVEGALNRAVG